MHHGILGQKWGIRRYQNPDGTLTEAGKKRYGVTSGNSIDDIKTAKGLQRRLNDVDKATARNYRAKGKQLSKINSKDYAIQNEKRVRKAEAIQKNIDKGHDEVERLLKKANDSGYTSKSWATRRLVDKGSTIIGKTLAVSTIGGLTLTSLGALGVATPAIVPGLIGAATSSTMFSRGTQYSVKDKKKKK